MTVKSSIAEPSALSDDAALTQLIYRSESLLGVNSGLQMSDILAEARPANARDDITGVLTAVNGVFVQILEGRAEALERLLSKLRTDPRHRHLEVMDRRSIARRDFGDWDMVSPRLAPVETGQIEHLLAGPAGLDAFIPVLRGAAARQDAVLEGRESPPMAIGRVASSGADTTSAEPES